MVLDQFKKIMQIRSISLNKDIAHITFLYKGKWTIDGAQNRRIFMHSFIKCTNDN